MKRFFFGEENELVTEDAIRELWEYSKKTQKNKDSYEEFLQDVTTCGGYYTEVRISKVVTMLEFIAASDSPWLDVENAKEHMFDNRTGSEGQFIGNPDNFNVEWVVDWDPEALKTLPIGWPYSCSSLIRDVFLPDTSRSVMSLPIEFPGIEIKINKDGCFLYGSGYEEVIRITDPENINVRY